MNLSYKKSDVGCSKSIENDTSDKKSSLNNNSIDINLHFMKSVTSCFKLE